MIHEGVTAGHNQGIYGLSEVFATVYRRTTDALDPRRL